MDSDDLEIDAAHIIPSPELHVRATKASGPGGQHVNTSSTRIELVWVPSTSAALNERERALVIERLATRLNTAGEIRLVSGETRSQLQNRERVRARLASLVRQALVPRKVRKATKPSRAAKEARLTSKKLQARKKAERQRPDWE